MPHPKLKNMYIMYIYIYCEYLLYLQSSASASFLQSCINFVELRLKFSHKGPSTNNFLNRICLLRGWGVKTNRIGNR